MLYIDAPNDPQLLHAVGQLAESAGGVQVKTLCGETLNLPVRPSLASVQILDDKAGILLCLGCEDVFHNRRHNETSRPGVPAPSAGELHSGPASPLHQSPES